MRRACLGELVQIDGCDHHWFEDRGPSCTALVYIDDATSRLMHILFTGTESTFGYFEATRQYLVQHGKPLPFYSDKASIFRVNHASATGGEGHTQFGRVLYELNIDGICANTPAAKGRVERAHLTMQDRLVKEFRLEGISSIEAANAFMQKYVAEIRQADIVNSKRLGSVLMMAREAQLASNERRSKSCPSRPFPSASAMQ